jgi:hypothetical protein
MPVNGFIESTSCRIPTVNVTLGFAGVGEVATAVPMLPPITEPRIRVSPVARRTTVRR